MNFLFLWHCYPSTNTGSGIPAAMLIRQLARLGHRVTLIFSDDGNSSSYEEGTSVLSLTDKVIAVPLARGRFENSLSLETSRIAESIMHPLNMANYLLSYS